MKIPAGVENGAKLRLKNLGQPGAGGGPNGDMIVTVRVISDKFFNRVGNDIVCSVPVTLEQAVDGARIKIRTLTGNAILNVPPMTQDGRKFKLPGLGIKTNAGTGNQYVIIKHRIPANPTVEEEKLMKKLRPVENTGV